MEQGATSQPGVTTRAMSGAITHPPQGPLSQDLPRPKTKDPVQPKETGKPSPREKTHDSNQEQVDESKDQDSRSHPSKRPWEKDNHQLAPSVGNLLDKDSRHDHKIGSKQSYEQSTDMSYDKSKSYVEEISRLDYYPRGPIEDGISDTDHQVLFVPQGEGNVRGSNDVIAKLQLQVEELNNRLKDIAPSKVIAKHSTLLPFLYRLRHESMPRGFRMPKFKTLYGMGDPSNHINAYDSQLSFWASEDDVYTKAFPSSLSGAALKWFHKLPPNSIDCWQDSVDLFMDKFGASIIAEQDEEALMNLKQKPEETLCDYPIVSKGWRKQKRQPKEQSRFIPETNHKDPQRLTCVGKIIEKPQEETVSKWRTKRKDSEKGEWKSKATSRAVYTSYTPLRTSMRKVYGQMEDMKLLPKPQKLRSHPNRQDPKLFCEYHKDHRQDTDDCRVLKAKIKKLIRRGHLKKFVRKCFQKSLRD
ncbi:hypothetical protein LIER_10689 [Lithospermum erythrorhizon]|uniref:Retrotransposon gag domain-containing protein n=1 Tax=Lithospermum erythrorhizon TaxID=34254 RepID=A0AAV3PMI8_LITER